MRCTVELGPRYTDAERRARLEETEARICAQLVSPALCPECSQPMQWLWARVPGKHQWMRLYGCVCSRTTDEPAASENEDIEAHRLDTYVRIPVRQMMSNPASIDA